MKADRNADHGDGIERAEQREVEPADGAAPQKPDGQKQPQEGPDDREQNGHSLGKAHGFFDMVGGPFGGDPFFGGSDDVQRSTSQRAKKRGPRTGAAHG